MGAVLIVRCASVSVLACIYPRKIEPDLQLKGFWHD